MDDANTIFRHIMKDVTKIATDKKKKKNYKNEN